MQDNPYLPGHARTRERFVLHSRFNPLCKIAASKVIAPRSDDPVEEICVWKYPQQLLKLTSGNKINLRPESTHFFSASMVLWLTRLSEASVPSKSAASAKKSTVRLDSRGTHRVAAGRPQVSGQVSAVDPGQSMGDT
jgi:hypothetical protein